MSSFFILGFFTMLENVFSQLGSFLKMIINYFLLSPLFMVFVGIMVLALFAELIFKKMAGLDTVYLGGNKYEGANNGSGQDLVYAFITEPAVQNVFWSIVGLSIVLLFIFTIVALIKSEFALDLKGSAKGPIIARALKSLANFIVVPITALISVVGVNFLTKTVYDLFETGNSSVVSKCFYVGSYNANRARLSSAFADQLRYNSYYDGDKIFWSGNPFENCSSQAEVAAKIDKLFMDSETIEDLDHNNWQIWDAFTSTAADDAYINLFMIFTGSPVGNTFNMLNPTFTFFYYDLGEFDWILAVGSAIAMVWILLSVSMALVKRIFELTILFLLAPPMIAIAPIDGGAAEKKWRQEFMKRILAVIAPVFAYNMYFLLVPLFSSISLFGGLSALDGAFMPSLSTGGTMVGSIIAILVTFYVLFDIMFQIICVIVGMSIVKSASALLSNILGVDDLVKAGDEMGKKAVKTGASAFKGAASLAVPAVKGAAMALKAAKGARAISKAGKYKRKTDSAKTAMDEIAKDDKKGVNSQEYADAKKKYEKAQQKQSEYEKKHSSSDDDLAKGFDSDKKAAYDKLDGLEKQKQELKEASKDKTLTFAQKMENSKKMDALNKEISSAKLDAYNKYGTKGGTGVGDKEKREAAIAKARKEEVKHLYTGEDFSTARKRIRKDLDDKEYGSDAKETSMFASMFEKDSKFSKAMDWMQKKGLYGDANKEMLKVMFNPDTSEFGNPYRRRFDDFMTEIAGDKGDINKILFNKNNRASELIENGPETKLRNTALDQKMSWSRKAEVDKDLEDKKARKGQEEILRRMLAEDKKGNRDMKEYLDLCKQKDNANPNDFARIDSLNAQINKAAVKNGLAAEARNYYDSMKKGDEGKAKKFEEYNNKMKLDAEDKQVKAEADKEQRIKDAAERNGVSVQEKMSNMTPEQLINAFTQALRNFAQGDSALKTTLKPDKTQEPIKIDATQLKEAINQLQDTFSGESGLIKSINNLIGMLSGKTPTNGGNG